VFIGYESALTTSVVIATILRCLLDKATRGQSSRGLVNSRTSQLSNNESSFWIIWTTVGQRQVNANS